MWAHFCKIMHLKLLFHIQCCNRLLVLFAPNLLSHIPFCNRLLVLFALKLLSFIPFCNRLLVLFAPKLLSHIPFYNRLLIFFALKLLSHIQFCNRSPVLSAPLDVRRSRSYTCFRRMSGHVTSTHPISRSFCADVCSAQ